MIRATIITATIITAAISLSACSQSSSNRAEIVYNTSVDVPLKHWTSADTLFYPVVIDEEPNLRHPIACHQNYRMRISVRHTSDFPLSAVPANISIQQTDTINGQTRVTRRVMQTAIAPRVRDEQGRALGTGWGSLYEFEEEVPDFTLQFDEPGTYRMLIIPAFRGALEGIDGMVSMGIELYK